MSDPTKKKKKKKKPVEDYHDDGADEDGNSALMVSHSHSESNSHAKKKKKKKKPHPGGGDASSVDEGGEDSEAPSATKKKKKKKKTGDNDDVDTSASRDAGSLLEEKIRAKAAKKKKKKDAAAAHAEAEVEDVYGRRSSPPSDEEKLEEDIEAGYGDDYDEDDYGSDYGEGNDNGDEDDSYDAGRRGGKSKSKKRRSSEGSSAAAARAAGVQRGGGDTRHKRPGASAVSGPGDDPAAAKGAGQRGPPPKRGKGFDPEGVNVNERYADMHTTGKWGGLSKWEQRGLAVLFLCIVAGAITAGVLLTRGPTVEPTLEPTNKPTRAPTGAPTTTPTAAPTDSDYREDYGLQIIRDASPKSTIRVASPEELIGKKFEDSSTPQEIAAEFVLYDDKMQIDAQDPRFLERYALSVFYYHNGGCSKQWNIVENWLDTSGLDHCKNWYGISCDTDGRVTSFGMASNFVQRSIPIELGQLKALREFDVSDNSMTGTVPVEAVALSTVFSIRIQNNNFEGSFPFEQVAERSNSLENLWIQENAQLEGSLPPSLCGLRSITLDCSKIEFGEEFEQRCISKGKPPPNEFTCSDGEGVAATRVPAKAPTTGGGEEGGDGDGDVVPTSSPIGQTYCGTPFPS